MWQEARKQEKKLRCIMIDYKKRAERRQAYYARMRMDPHQLMRVYGQKCKFHLVADNAKVSNTDGQLMPWQGDPEIMIDRFDVRAHLDIIPEVKNSEVSEEPLTAEEEKFQRKCSYERYRTLVQIDATGASEEQYLKQLELEEGVGRTEMENKRRMENDKMTSKATAKFHYKYDDSSEMNKENFSSDDDNDSDGSDSDGDLSDIDINVNVLDLTEEQTNHLDALATSYGIGYGQYCKQLLLEKKEFEYVKKLEEEEEERAKMPGRKGKSARRSLRAKQKTLRGSPLSFALHEGSPHDDDERSKREGSTSSDSSNDHSKIVESKVEFITSFGGEDETNGSGIILPPPVPRKKSDERSNSHQKHTTRKRSRSRSREKSSQDHKSRERHKSRSKSREHRSRHSKSHDRHRKSSSHSSRHSSRTKNESHGRERSYSSHNTHTSRSRSPRNSSSNRSRSRSRDSNHRNTSKSSIEKSNDRSRRHSRSRSRSWSRSLKVSSKRKSRSRSRSRGRSKSRSKSIEKRSQSPHGTIAKRLSGDVPQATVVDKSTLTPREKMKLRMQKLLNRQIKSDKKEEHKKQVAKEQEIEERDMEIYEMSRIMRMKEREKRVYRSPSPKGRIPSYDASRFKYVRSKSSSPE